MFIISVTHISLSSLYVVSTVISTIGIIGIIFIDVRQFKKYGFPKFEEKRHKLSLLLRFVVLILGVYYLFVNYWSPSTIKLKNEVYALVNSIDDLKTVEGADVNYLAGRTTNQLLNYSAKTLVLVDNMLNEITEVKNSNSSEEARTEAYKEMVSKYSVEMDSTQNVMYELKDKLIFEKFYEVMMFVIFIASDLVLIKRKKKMQKVVAEV